MCYTEKVSHLKILLPCFSSVTHTMWWLPPIFSDGAEFAFAAPSFLPFAWWCYWTGWIYPPLHLPLGLVEWMTMSGCDGRVLADALLVWWRIAAVPGAEEEPSPQEKIQECWGWWRGSPHLSQWRHAKSEMYRIYTFFLSTVVNLLSHSFLSSGYFQTLFKRLIYLGLYT